MEYHRISFIHNDTEYSFIKAMNDRLVGYALMSACHTGKNVFTSQIILLHINLNFQSASRH